MTTYYVDGVSGDDGNGGESFGDAWETIQFAADTATAGDIVRICATGTYAPSATIDFDTNAGTATAYVQFVGANSEGDIDGTQAVIDGGGISSADCMAVSGGIDYLRFENLRVTGATDDGLSIGSGSDYVFVKNCGADNCASAGIISSGSYTHVLLCSAESNGSVGIQVAAVGKVSLCSASSNTTYGIYSTGFGCAILSNVVHRNGTNGLVVNVVSSIIRGNVAALNSGDGIYLPSVSGIGSTVLSSNILALNGAYGLSVNGTPDGWGLCDYNCLYSNTSGNTDLAAVPGNNNIIDVDPQFISTTEDFEDFRLQRTSPCWAAGIGGAAR